MGVQECGAWVGSFWGCWWSCAFGHGAWVVLASALLGLLGLFAVPRLLWRSGPFSHLLRLLAGLNYIFMLALATGVHFDACFSHSTLVFSAGDSGLHDVCVLVIWAESMEVDLSLQHKLPQ